MMGCSHQISTIHTLIVIPRLRPLCPGTCMQGRSCSVREGSSCPGLISDTHTEAFLFALVFLRTLGIFFNCDLFSLPL
jgi:hypothetical protein